MSERQNMMKFDGYQQEVMVLRKKKIMALLISMVLASSSLVACGSSGSYSGAGAMSPEIETYYETPATVPPDFASSEATYNTAGRVNGSASYDSVDEKATSTQITSDVEGAGLSSSENLQNGDTSTAVEQKIVTTYDISLETLEFDQAVDLIDTMTEQSGGYFESSQISGQNLYASNTYGSRSATYVILVPSAGGGAFINSLKDSFNVVYVNETSENITATYYDIQSQLQSLQERKVRLEGMLANATDLEYMFQIEREIADVTANINYLYTQIQLMDKVVSMTTIYVSLKEVSLYEDPLPTPNYTFGEEIGRSFQRAIRNFSNGMQNFVLFVVEHFVGVTIFFILVIVLFIVIRRSLKKQKLRKEQWYAQIAAGGSGQTNNNPNPSPLPPTSTPPVPSTVSQNSTPEPKSKPKK